MKKFMVAILFVGSSAFAQGNTDIGSSAGNISDTPIVTGANAMAMYNSMNSDGRKLNPNESDETATLIKVQNLTNGSRYSIQEGERGIICDKYKSIKVIESMGTEYFCHLVDLTNLKRR